MTRSVQVTFDCSDPAAQAAFWAAALGYDVQGPPPGFTSWEQALDAWGVPAERRNDASAAVDPTGAGPRLFFQRVPEPKTVKNRVHLDLRGESMADEVARLVALGAAVVAERALGDTVRWTVMEDPEGNEFCVSGD